jgi:hypothetical protein
MTIRAVDSGRVAGSVLFSESEKVNVKLCMIKEFGVQPSGFSAPNIIVWLTSLGLSAGIVFGVHKYVFRK